MRLLTELRQVVDPEMRRYRREPSPLVRNADGSWRTGKYDSVLGGNFDLLAAAELCWMSLPRKAGEG